jgi:hypothetical protein
MKWPTRFLFFLVALAMLSVAGLPRVGLCAPSPTAVGVTIDGQGFGILKDFFARFAQGRANKVPDDEVKRVLLQAIPEGYRKGWSDAMARGPSGFDRSPTLTVRVLYVDGRKDEKSIRALVTFALLQKAESTPATRYDERLAAIVIDRDAALLSMMEQEKDWKEGRLVHILQEKEIHIRGRGLVGLNFTTLSDDPNGADAAVKQETVNFYLFQDNGVKFAGSVLKMREERVPGGPVGARSVYRGSIIFKKDMKGNIVGILSPYTVTEEDKRVDKGMVRYTWDAGAEAFVREQP